jgi:adenylate kinase family enzyme/transcriptional regulator with XRE-family HTH domain
MRSTKFGQLLKAGINSAATCEGKTAPVIEAELGQQIGVSPSTIQRYKAGYVPSEASTIQILAELAVKRGHLNRDWLKDFLLSAHYTGADSLIARLYPDNVPTTSESAIYTNLPSPTYGHFVMREQAFREVLDGLQQRSAIVLIVGLSGTGKTSLAREVAAQSLLGNYAVPQFEAVVWISDKDQPGTVNLNEVLNEVARTLDYSGLVQLPIEERKRKINHILGKQRTLIVVDNFETVQDQELLYWLLRLPEPSKAIITSRKYNRSFRNSTFVVELRGLNQEEARLFTQYKAKSLRIEHLAPNIDDFMPLVDATGGNPKGIELALGCVKYERQQLQQVIDDLCAARGSLFDDLFSKAWSLLDEAARKVLLVMVFFANDVNGDALARTADVQGASFDRALDLLIDLSLIDVRQRSLYDQPRYTVHPLVYSFASSKLKERPEFEQEARNRWVKWYVSLTSTVGYCWRDITKLQVLDPEIDTIHSIIVWTLAKKRFDDLISLAKGARYYYFVRGLWNKKPYINLVEAEASQQVGDSLGELQALCYYVQIISRQGLTADANQYLHRIIKLTSEQELSADLLFDVKHATALHAMSQDNLKGAEEAWRESMTQADRLSAHLYTVNRQWLAKCLLLQGRMSEAQGLLNETLLDAIRFGIPRAIMFCQINLINIELHFGNLDEIEGKLVEIFEILQSHQDKEHLAEAMMTQARFLSLTGYIVEARSMLEQTIEALERLGLHNELVRARRELASLL